MRALSLLIFLLLLAVSAWAQGQSDIYDQEGKRQGFTREDPYNRDRLDLYDKDSKRTGYLERDSYQPDRFNVYDQDGKRKGYIEGNRIHGR